MKFSIRRWIWLQQPFPRQPPSSLNRPSDLGPWIACDFIIETHVTFHLKKPVNGLDASARFCTRPTPARKASRPASTPFLNAPAMASGSSGDSDRGVDQDGISAHFHRFAAWDGTPETGIDHHRDIGFFDDDFDRVPGPQSPVGTDRRSQRHDRGDPDVFQTFGEDGISLNIGQHHEAFFDQYLRGLQGFHRVGQQVEGIRSHFQFDPGLGILPRGPAEPASPLPGRLVSEVLEEAGNGWDR